MEKTLKQKLLNIQQKLKCNKGQFNKHGQYKYRSCEDILEAVKPLLEAEQVILLLMDDIHFVEGRFYVKANAVLKDIDSNEEIKVSAYARETEKRTGMDDSQLTGATSSYARKYALNGLFCLDDTKDADTNEYVEKTQETRNKEPLNVQQTVTKTETYKPVNQSVKVAVKTIDESIKGKATLEQLIILGKQKEEVKNYMKTIYKVNELADLLEEDAERIISGMRKKGTLIE